MVAQYVADLTREVSAPRLARYRPAGGSDLDMAVNYFWNMSLAGALHPSLSALEIGVRNSIHNALTANYASDLWFHHPHFTRNRNLGREVNRAIDRLGGPASQPTAGRIVAELHFAYWTTLLSGYYHRLLWNPDRAALLHAVFPHLTGPGFQRHLIHGRYNEIRIFRNRVMHHEPLIYGLALRGQPTISLDATHNDILEAIGWVSPRLQTSLVFIDRFPDVLAQGRETIEAALRQHLGI